MDTLDRQTLDAICYHLEMGKDNADIGRDALAKFLRTLPKKADAALAQATTDHQRIITELQAQVASLTQQLDYQIESVRPELITQARREEREACAMLCENIGGVTGETLAERIRARRP